MTVETEGETEDQSVCIHAVGVRKNKRGCAECLCTSSAAEKCLLSFVYITRSVAQRLFILSWIVASIKI